MYPQAPFSLPFFIANYWGTTKTATSLWNSWMSSPVSSWDGVWRCQFCDKRGCGDPAVPPCLIPTAPTSHPLVTDVGYSWIVLTGSQFWCFHLKQAHFCCCCCCEDVFRPAELSQSGRFSLELVQVGAQDSCSRIYLFKNIPAAPLSLGNCKNNSIKNKPANKGEKAELCEDMKYSRLNSAGKLFPPPVPFQGWNDVLWFLNTNPDLHKSRDFICAELQIAGIVIPGYFMAHP